ncbi:MAG: 30S ribosomal protein S27ae [Candidatus Diapherotrites archaeon]|nr:30S ribosomal protein S27ae [Candidatus Diapherotrites archaeon]
MAERERKGKKVHKPKKKMKKHTYYKISETTITRSKKACPKCGAGVFLAEHKNRSTCGTCKYTEMKN